MNVKIAIKNNNNNHHHNNKHIIPTQHSAERKKPKRLTIFE